MEKEVIVKVIGSGELSDGDQVVTEARGRYYEKDGKTYIFYDLPDENDHSVVVKHKVLLAGNSMKITKTSGDTKSEIHYLPGRKTSSAYATPYGVLDLTFHTKRFDTTKSDGCLIVELVYDILMGEEVLSANNLKMIVTEC